MHQPCNSNSALILLLLLLSNAQQLLDPTMALTTLAPPSKQTQTSLADALSVLQNPYAQYYPKNWPKVPFHDGELQMQHAVGVHERVMAYAPRMIRPYMPEQHRDFFANQPFLVAAARDPAGRLWATLLTRPSTGQADMTQSSTPTTLELTAAPVAGDALHGALTAGTDLGLLGIEFATKRRNRVNGRIVQVTAPTDNGTPEPLLTFAVDQSFGNCPQYIKPRQWWSAVVPDTENQQNSGGDSPACEAPSDLTTAKLGASQRTTALSARQMAHIAQADTILVATGYRGSDDDVRFGNDASHRGGPAGFVQVRDAQTLVLPEFAGNNMFNSLGNLLVDARMGVTIPSFGDGGMLQLTGQGEIDTDAEKAAATYPGALRLVTFHIDQVNEVPAGSLPIRWSVPQQAESRPLRVTSIVQESADVKSFYLQPPEDEKNENLWKFTAGQHLPLQLRTPHGELLRTYSLSGSPLQPHQYRISVKREPMGQASTYLHTQVQVGDVVQVSRPAGEFALETSSSAAAATERPLVLLSSGIGVTPILSMLHQQVQQKSRRQVYWVHGARDGEHHPFRDEVKSLLQQADSVKSHVVYSQPSFTDKSLYDSQGHVDVALLERLVPNLAQADVYMCGNASFLASIEEELQAAGVDPQRIFFETF